MVCIVYCSDIIYFCNYKNSGSCQCFLTALAALLQNEGNQEFLKGLCNMAHALGITVIALGVESKDDLPLLAKLGFDGATGPGVG